MNVLLPNSENEFVEYPLPEQFKTKLNNGKLATTPAESA
jgi:hypothetical protein